MNIRIHPSAFKLIQFSIIAAFLSGCMGDNQQFFQDVNQVTPTTTLPGVTGTTSSPSPTASPSGNTTPTPTATPSGGGSTPTPTATPSGSSTPNPTATPVDALPPVANNDGPYEIAVNQTLTLTTAALLQNDTDPHGLPIHFVSNSNASSGTLTLSGSAFTFQPVNNFAGTVTFTYTIANSLNLTASATVTINVRIPATEAMYGESSSTLYSYNPTTNQSTSIATFKLASGSSISIFDIAINTNGLMYGVDGSNLYYINATTGVVTLIPTTGLGNFGDINGLTALSDGTLVISGNGIAAYNIATQSLTTLLAPGGYQSSGDIIALPDDYLYMAVTTNGSDHLVKVNPTTGATTDLGSLGQTGVYGLGYANGTLYGFATNGLVFEINPTNAATSYASSTGINWYGATTNPVLW
jgi:hypothetical protein